MRSVETDGATIDEAIARALDLLHIERDKVDIEILDSASRGLLGFGGKKARVRATVRTPVAGAQGERYGDGVSRETRLPEAATSESAVEAARHVLERLLQELGIDSEIETLPQEAGAWEFRARGEASGIVIGRHGQTLDALEYLLGRIASHRSGTLIRIAVDIEGYRERRQLALEQQAGRAATEALETLRPVVLEPMTPRDRRLVHLALAETPGVTTSSRGEGGFRQVVITPTRSPDRGGR
jgi:spoIIIJ-associated protein